MKRAILLIALIISLLFNSYYIFESKNNVGIIKELNEYIVLMTKFSNSVDDYQKLQSEAIDFQNEMFVGYLNTNIVPPIEKGKKLAEMFVKIEEFANQLGIEKEELQKFRDNAKFVEKIKVDQ